VIAILTDFGLQDSYVGIMKGVIHRFHPTAQIIDLTHQIPSGDVRRGAFEIWRASRYLPDKTILVGVVDPGVGTERRPIAIEIPNRTFVGPDNGLFTLMLPDDEPTAAVQIRADFELPWEISRTFHGRDIFAPAAAHLAAGLPLSDLGEPIEDPIQIQIPTMVISDAEIQGEVLHVDGFGNLVTNIGIILTKGKWMIVQPWRTKGDPIQLDQASSQAILPDGQKLPVLGSFGEAGHGDALAYIGSSGNLEIGINGGSAAETFGLQVGSKVFLQTLKG
jgi:S-adenosylmethionine hydrolase